MLLWTIFILGGFFLQAESCDIEKGILLPVTALKDCMNKIPFDKTTTEFNQTIDVINYYLNGYAYRDVMLNLPSPHANDMDIVSKVRTALTDSSIKDTYSFHERIATSISEMKDAHAAYVMPCSDNFVYLFPYLFTLEADSISSLNPTFTLRTIAYVLPHINITKRHLEKTGHPDLTNKIITRLKIDGIPSITNELPEKTLARWADKYNPSSRTSPAQFISTISEFFSFRSPGVTPIPEKSVTITYKSEEGSQDTEDIDVPFYLISIADVTDFDTFCPLVSKTKETVTEAANTLPIRQDKSNDRHAKLQEIFQQEMEYMPEMPLQKLLKSVKANPPMLDRSSAKNELPTPTVVINETHMVGYYIQEWNMTYLHVKTFNCGDEIVKFLEDMIKAIEKAVKTKSRFVLDLRGNGGGFIALGTLLKHYMYPTHYPINPEVKYVSHEFTNAISKKWDDAGSYTVTTDPETNKRITGINTAPATPTSTSGCGTTRTQSWTRRFAFNTDRFFPLIDPDVSTTIRNKRLFSPSDLTVLTDGSCGSTCGQFVKHLAEHRLGRIIGLGWDFMGERGFDVASFAAGSVVNTDLAKTSFPSKDPHSLFPRKNQRMSFVMMDSLSQSAENKDERWEFKIINPDAVYPIFDHPSSLTQEGRMATLERLLPILEKHYSWEVQDSNCTPTTKKANEVYGHPWNEDEKVFDTTKCVFSRCVDTHYLKDNKECVERPPWFDKDDSSPDKSKMSAGAIVGIVVAVVVVVGAAVVIIILLIRRRRRQGAVKPYSHAQKSSDLTTALL